MRFRLHKSKVVQVFMISMFIGMSFASGTNFDESDLSNNDYVLALFYESTSGETLDHGIISSWYMDPVRWQEVYIRQEIFDISRQNKGDLIQLNVFDDRILTGTISDVVEYIKGTKTVYGSINEAFYGTFVIAITDDTCLITIRIPSERELFITQFDSTSNVHYTVELDINLYRDEPYAGPLIPPVEDELSDDGIHDTFNEKALTSLDAFNSQTNTNIDIMMVYTPAARDWANTYGGGIVNVVSTAMANAQMVMENSQTYVTMRLVYSGVVNYEESSKTDVNLMRLTLDSDGYMTEVHEWRDKYGADLVQLFTYAGSSGGMAWQLQRATGSPNYAFSTIKINRAATTYNSIHEMGHNMGCHHHKEQNFQPGPGLFPYSAGWRWTSDGENRYCSVMTYTSGWYFEDGITNTPLPYFSNPDVYHEGIPTGNSDHADNARTIRMVKDAIAAYRSETGIVTKAGGPYFGEPGEEIQFTGNVFGGVEPYSWEWDFGDGSVSTLESPVHTYSEKGTFALSLTITDGHGKKSMSATTAYIFPPIGVLSCNGLLTWSTVRRETETSQSFTIANVGEINSVLNWDIVSYPDWGTWSFNPANGEELTPQDDEIIVEVTVIAPKALLQTFEGHVIIQNRDNPLDSCMLPVSMVVFRTIGLNPWVRLLNMLSDRFFIFRTSESDLN